MPQVIVGRIGMAEKYGLSPQSMLNGSSLSTGKSGEIDRLEKDTEEKELELKIRKELPELLEIVSKVLKSWTYTSSLSLERESTQS